MRSLAVTYYPVFCADCGEPLSDFYRIVRWCSCWGVYAWSHA